MAQSVNSRLRSSISLQCPSLVPAILCNRDNSRCWAEEISVFNHKRFSIHRRISPSCLQRRPRNSNRSFYRLNLARNRQSLDTLYLGPLGPSQILQMMAVSLVSRAGLRLSCKWLVSHHPSRSVVEVRRQSVFSSSNSSSLCNRPSLQTSSVSSPEL